MQARIPLGVDFVLLFSGRPEPTPTAVVHQHNVYSRAIEGMVSPGEPEGTIENTYVGIETKTVGAVDKMQFFW